MEQEGNDPVPHHDEFGSRAPTMADLYRIGKEQVGKSDSNLERMKNHFDQQDEKLDELMEMTRGTQLR